MESLGEVQRLLRELKAAREGVEGARKQVGRAEMIAGEVGGEDLQTAFSLDFFPFSPIKSTFSVQRAPPDPHQAARGGQ